MRLNPRKGLDRMSIGLAALTMVPAFFVGGIIYAGLFHDPSVSGIYMASLITAGICLPPLVLAIRGILGLALLLVNRILQNSPPGHHRPQ